MAAAIVRSRIGLMRTLNVGSGKDPWGTDKLDWKNYGQKGIRIFDFNIEKRLPYKANLFDEIRLHGILEFMVYPQELLEECHRVLKKDGILSIRTINLESLRFFIRPLRGQGPPKNIPHLENGKIMTLWNLHTLSNRLALAGFEILSTSKSSNIPPFKDNIQVIARRK